MILEWGKLHNADCLEAMRQMPDNFADLAIVDPPYGVGMSGGIMFGGPGGRRRFGDRLREAWPSKNYKYYLGGDVAPSPDYFTELFRVSRAQIIWGANHYIENLPRQNTPCWIVWDKYNGNFSTADCELAWTSFATAVRKFKYRWAGFMQEYTSGHPDFEKRIHPNQKPIALYRWLLAKYSMPGDKILDTHVGSASSLIACWEMGHDFIGFEIDPDYCQAAQKRMDAAFAQPRLIPVEEYRAGMGVAE